MFLVSRFMYNYFVDENSSTFELIGMRFNLVILCIAQTRIACGCIQFHRQFYVSLDSAGSMKIGV